MKASSFEFRNRFWIIGGIFWVGFWLYFADHQSATHAIAQWLSPRDGWSQDTNEKMILWIGAALAMLTVGIRVWATSYLRAEVMTDHALHSDRLVADGPYRFVRNPLYLGNMFLAASMAPLASRTGAAVLILGMLFFVLRLIGREESELRSSQGESYARYTRSVPKIIPALWPRVPVSGAQPRWGQALLGEGFIIAFAAGVVAFAITQNQRFFWAAMLTGFAIAGVSHWVIACRRKALSRKQRE